MPGSTEGGGRFARRRRLDERRDAGGVALGRDGDVLGLAGRDEAAGGAADLALGLDESGAVLGDAGDDVQGPLYRRAVFEADVQVGGYAEAFGGPSGGPDHRLV